MAVKSGIFVSVLSLQCLLGQQDSAAIRPPAIGLVFDAGAQTLSPILGIPGASLLGAPLDLLFPVVNAAVSVRGDYILVLGGNDQAVKLLRSTGDGFSATSIEGAASGPDRMVLSPNGSTAALYRAADGLIQLVVGLPDSPVVASAVHYASPEGTFGPMAVSDDGKALLVASNSLMLIASDGLPRALPVPGPVSAMAFRPQSHDALVAETSDNQVFLVRNTIDNVEYQVVATQNDGISEPVGVGFSADGLRAFVANSDTGNIVILDLTGGPSSLISCGCSASGLYPLNVNSVFRLNEPSDRPLMLLDGHAPQPRVVFVPRERSDQ